LRRKHLFSDNPHRVNRNAINPRQDFWRTEQMGRSSGSIGIEEGVGYMAPTFLTDL
jgi:hypothetical protein